MSRTDMTLGQRWWFALDGDDTSGDGSITSPFRTFNEGIPKVCREFDFRGNAPTFATKKLTAVQLAAGLSYGSVSLPPYDASGMNLGGGPARILGADPADPTDYAALHPITVVDGACILNAMSTCVWRIEGMDLQSVNGVCIEADDFALLQVKSCRFRPSEVVLQAIYPNALIQLLEGIHYFATGNYGTVFDAIRGGTINCKAGAQVAAEGTMNVSKLCHFVDGGAVYLNAMSFLSNIGGAARSGRDAGRLVCQGAALPSGLSYGTVDASTFALSE